MIRNLKVLFGAVLVVTALGAIGASLSQAAKFHCSVEPCRFTLDPDGVGKVAHHVFIIDDKNTKESVSFTCARLTGEGTAEFIPTTEATVTNLNYNDVPCTIDGSTGVTVNMMGCDYRFNSAGTVRVECPTGERIRIEKTGCTYEIGPQGPLNGILFFGGRPEITAAANVANIAVTMTGTTAACLLNPADEFEGTYTTGNTRMTAETDSEFSVMAECWWE
jgi:hypothetical protein